MTFDTHELIQFVEPPERRVDLRQHVQGSGPGGGVTFSFGQIRAQSACIAQPATGCGKLSRDKEEIGAKESDGAETFRRRARRDGGRRPYTGKNSAAADARRGKASHGAARSEILHASID